MSRIVQCSCFLGAGSRLILLFVYVLMCAVNSYAQFDLEKAFPNLTFVRPVDLQHPDDGSNRLFVIEQQGIVQVFENSMNVSASPVFLDISDRVNDSGNEEGLLGLAFNPDYAANWFFDVNYTASNPDRTVIARYSVKPDDGTAALKDSEFIILEVSQPFPNHNGGQLSHSVPMVTCTSGSVTGDLTEIRSASARIQVRCSAQCCVLMWTVNHRTAITEYRRITRLPGILPVLKKKFMHTVYAIRGGSASIP